MAKQTVLIVDDSNFMRNTLRDEIESDEYTVIAEADTGKSAFENYKKYNPDIVTMDIVMPNGGGIEAIKNIIEYNPKALIVVITAVGHEPMITRAIRAGALNFVIKPFKKGEVMEAIKELYNLMK